MSNTKRKLISLSPHGEELEVWLKETHKRLITKRPRAAGRSGGRRDLYETRELVMEIGLDMLKEEENDK